MRYVIWIWASALIAFFSVASYCDVKMMLGVPTHHCSGQSFSKTGTAAQVSHWLKTDGGGMCRIPQLDVEPYDAMRRMAERKEMRT